MGADLGDTHDQYHKKCKISSKSQPKYKNTINPLIPEIINKSLASHPNA